MMTDPKRIVKLSESPCYKCGCIVECADKIKENYKLGVIRDNAFGNRAFDYHKCGIWIALNSPEMVGVKDG